jgi:hypothetical protein
VLSEGISTILPFTFSRRELLESNHFDNWGTGMGG